MKLLILNGPNLNLLGQREPDIYGRQSYDDLCKLIYEHAAAVGCQAELFQSNLRARLSTLSRPPGPASAASSSTPGPMPITATPSMMLCAAPPSRRWRCIFPISTPASPSGPCPSPRRPALESSPATDLPAISKPWTICSNTPITLRLRPPAAALGRHLYDQQKALSYRRPRGS